MKTPKIKPQAYPAYTAQEPPLSLISGAFGANTQALYGAAPPARGKQKSLIGGAA